MTKKRKKEKKKDGKLISCVFLVAPWWGVAGKKDQRGRKDSHLVGRRERERGISHDTLAARSSSRCLWCFPMGGLAFFVAPKEEEEEEEECLQNGRLHTNSQTHILPTGSFLKESHII